MAARPSVVILVADGARPDTISDAMTRGDLPALSRLRSEGSSHQVTTVFPSVTGAAYTPFLLGKHPGPLGIPGIRWFDRQRAVTKWPSWTRSYMGFDLRSINADLDPASPTMFELAKSRLGALSFIERGLPARDNVVAGAKFFWRTAYTHFFGGLAEWMVLDRTVADEACDRIAREKPGYAFVAMASIDKASHATGHDSPTTRTAMQAVDQVLARIREDAERDGRWESINVMVVSDHGHSPVKSHEDLAGLVASLGVKVRAHPWTAGPGHEVAVMVSGNAMAHLYLDLKSCERRWWRGQSGTWTWLVDALLERDSVDVIALPLSETSVEVRSKTRGTAIVSLEDGRYAYRPAPGDPLGFGELSGLTADESWDATVGSDYPDALVQLVALCGSARCGDIVISAAREWDLRAKWEPIPHVSTHGALHREHMLVPLISNRCPAQVPRRTVDVFAAARRTLGV